MRFHDLPLAVVVALAATLAPSPVDAAEPHGSFVSLDLQLSRVNGGLGVILGLSGGYQTRGGTTLGLGLYDLLDGTPFPSSTGPGPLRRTKMHFAGLIVGQDVLVEGGLRVTASALVGLGDVSAYVGSKSRDFDRSVYWFAQPSLSLGVPVAAHFRPTLSAGYRFHAGVRTRGTGDGVLGGPFVGLSGTFPDL